MRADLAPAVFQRGNAACAWQLGRHVAGDASCKQAQIGCSATHSHSCGGLCTTQDMQLASSFGCHHLLMRCHVSDILWDTGAPDHDEV